MSLYRTPEPDLRTLKRLGNLVALAQFADLERETILHKLKLYRDIPMEYEDLIVFLAIGVKVEQIMTQVSRCKFKVSATNLRTIITQLHPIYGNIGMQRYLPYLLLIPSDRPRLFSRYD